MSQSIAAKAERGAHELIGKAERLLQDTVAEFGPLTHFTFPNTVYYLPIILAQSAKTVETLGDLETVLQQARYMLASSSSLPAQNPNTGLATLLAAETIETLRAVKAFAEGVKEERIEEAYLNSPLSDLEVRSWGIQLADARMPGLALLMGCARTNAVAVALVKHLRRHNIACFVSSSSNGRSIIDQLREENIELGEHAGIIPLGTEPTSASHALGFAARCAMRLGGHRPGMYPNILRHAKRRTPGFVLALGELDEPTCAVALAASDFGFQLIFDTSVPTSTQNISMPFEAIDGKDDIEKAERLIEQCIAARGLKLPSYGVRLPVAYGPGFEDEIISNANMQIQFGGMKCTGFELLQSADPEVITDGKVELIGLDVPDLGRRDTQDLALIVKVAGRKLQSDYEPYLERQIHNFINYTNGVKLSGCADEITIRISKDAAAKGITLQSLGNILLARYREQFTAIEKIEIVLITEPKLAAEWQLKACKMHDLRNKRLAALTDNQVDEFFVCTNCRSFTPNNVSVISPERVSPCGQCNWLDAKAEYEMSRTSVRHPVKLGRALDIQKGIWEGTNDYAKAASRGRINEVALYSIAQSPMCACADFECIVMLIPEANGVMVVAHDDTSPTPAGINIDVFASIAAGEQIPGIVGIGKYHLLSPKFISAEGGFKRVVWMSSVLKETMSEELKAVCIREGDERLMDKIADEHKAMTVAQLVEWLKAHKHPALKMERMY